MDLIAHRGAPNKVYPENSMSAFGQAVKDGLTFLEFDLRLTEDDQFVVIHDDTLQRTCDVPESHKKTPVGWLTAEEIRSCPLLGTGEPVPTLEQMLSLLEEHPEVTLLPELKDHSPHAARLLMGQLRHLPGRGRIIIQSLEHRQLEMIGEATDLSVCPLYRFRPESVDGLRCEWEAPMAEGLLFRPSTVQQVHRSGRKVAAWFLVTERWQWLRRHLEEKGVDAIMVDTYSR